MLKRLLCLLMILLVSLSFAHAEDGLVVYTDDELLDMMAAIPEEGEEDNSAFLVLPEDIPMPADNTYTILLVGSDAYDDDNRGRSDTTILVQVDGDSKTIRLASFLIRGTRRSRIAKNRLSLGLILPNSTNRKHGVR